MGSLSIWHWLVVLAVVVVLFGTTKLRNVGSDLGSAIKSFRKGLQEDEPPAKLDAESGREAEKTREKAAENKDA